MLKLTFLLNTAKLIRESFDAAKRVVKSYQLMLDFYGMKLVDKRTGEIARRKKYFRRYINLNQNSHNNLRISMLYSRFLPPPPTKAGTHLTHIKLASWRVWAIWAFRGTRPNLPNFFKRKLRITMSCLLAELLWGCIGCPPWMSPLKPLLKRQVSHPPPC